jgi:hypothetical protein
VSRESPQEEIIISENAETPAAEPQRDIWRFYFIDVIILGAGGGFCLIMILRERKKTKEALK